MKKTKNQKTGRLENIKRHIVVIWIIFCMLALFFWMMWINDQDINNGYINDPNILIDGAYCVYVVDNITIRIPASVNTTTNQSGINLFCGDAPNISNYHRLNTTKITTPTRNNTINIQLQSIPAGSGSS